MKLIFKSNYFFVIPFFVFLVAGAIILLLNSKADLHLALNAYHNPFFDYLFFYLTFLGDGIVPLLFSIIFLVVNYRSFLLIALSNACASLIAQILKRFFFEESLRPKKFFEGLHELYFLPGVDNHSYFSFPSGHSTTAFTLFFAFALLVKNNTLKFLFFLIALSVAFSRVYLSQHFFEDIYAGAIIGFFTTLFFYLILSSSNAKWLNKSIINTFKQQ